MNTLLLLTWRGTLMVLIVAGLDRALSAKIKARARRGWWLLVPAAFLLTLPLPVLPTRHPVPAAVQPDRVAGGQPGTAAPARLEVPARTPPRFLLRWAGPLAMAAGSIVYLLIAVARTQAAWRRWGHECPCADAALLAVLEDCRTTAGVTTAVGLIVSKRVSAPLILGWRRPRILLPCALVAASSREQLRGVLLHELAHHRFGDIPCTWLFSLVCGLHWFNPAAHFALREWARFREEAADEVAIGWLGQASGLEYGGTLLHVLRHAHDSPPTPGVALAIVESVSQLRKRLTMIKHYEHRSTHPLLAGAILVTAATGVLLRPVRAQSSSPSGFAEEKPAPTPPTAAADDRRALIDTFKKKGYSVPESFVDERVDAVVREQFGGDRAAFLQRLQAQGYSEARFREEEREKIMAQAMHYRLLADAQEAKAQTLVLPEVVVTGLSLADTVARLAAEVRRLYPQAQKMDPRLDPQAPQALKDAKVTLNLHQVSLLEVMRSLAQQTNARVSADSQGLGLGAKLTEPGGETSTGTAPQPTQAQGSAAPTDASLNQLMQTMQQDAEQATPEQAGLRILKGFCGADGAWRDVTETLRGSVKQNALQIAWEQPYSEIGGDPAYGRIKTLLVTYQLDGKTRLAAFQEKGDGSPLQAAIK